MAPSTRSPASASCAGSRPDAASPMRRCRCFISSRSSRRGTAARSKYSLMSADAEPNHLLLDGPFTNRRPRQPRGARRALRAQLLLAHLRPDGRRHRRTRAIFPIWVSSDAKDKLCDDDAMRHIGAIPHLRMLMGQGTVASDQGFAALSRSQTIEYIWGRECPNLTGRGFAALSTMPALRGLAVSCKNVDDAALSTLPRFPALAESDADGRAGRGLPSRRHGARTLEGLWCMYCRDTTDAATEHIAGLSKLKTYYAGQTKITDRSLRDSEPHAVAREARVLELRRDHECRRGASRRASRACARSASTVAGKSRRKRSPSFPRVSAPSIRSDRGST